MLHPRIIPCLLVKNKGLVKTTRFKNPVYVGDPINAVRIFNDKQADELLIVDIDATVEGKEPDYQMIEHWASECRMPLGYGGGIKTTDQAMRIFSLGVEKVAVSAAVINNPEIISAIAKQAGSQSIAVVIDVKKKLFGGYEVCTHNGKTYTGKNPVELATQAEDAGAGEIIINSIDHDGMMKGYDVNLVDIIRQKISLPITVLGGAGSLEDMGLLIKKFGIIGAAAGSLFVFKGVHKAVLINYPGEFEKEQLFRDNLSG